MKSKEAVLDSISKGTKDLIDFDDKCLSAYFGEAEKRSIEELSNVKHFKKGHILIKEGQMVDHCYYVIKGCLRQYKIVKGEERTVYFFTEDESILSLTQNNSIYLSNHYIECVEDTTVSVMSSTNERELYRRHPNIESMSRLSLEKLIRKYQDMYSDFITLTPEERYLNLVQRSPQLLNRIPQYQIASYLGIKPESLSRIRKRLAAQVIK